MRQPLRHQVCSPRACHLLKCLLPCFWFQEGNLLSPDQNDTSYLVCDISAVLCYSLLSSVTGNTADIFWLILPWVQTFEVQFLL